MDTQDHFRASDVHGISRLMRNAVDGTIDIVETTHRHIARMWGIPELSRRNPISILNRAVYGSIRAVTDVAGTIVDSFVERFVPQPEDTTSSTAREAVMAAMNGLIGDHLAATGNPFAIPMRFRVGGERLPLDRKGLKEALPAANGKVLILIHGLCKNDLQWRRREHDHGEMLARDLGYTPVYLHYNTGLHISVNGREFADMAEELVSNWPCAVEELTILSHSMGGLVARSAFHYASKAGYAWPGKLGHMIFLGTPHHGAPLERGGNWLGTLLGSNPYTMPVARLGRMRSAGITDLRHGNLLDEDWHGHDRFAHAHDLRRPVPLPDSVKCYAVAGTTGRRVGDIRDRMLGDGLVPLESALGRHKELPRKLAFPKSRRWIAYGVHHLDLLSSAGVYARIRDWLDESH